MITAVTPLAVVLFAWLWYRQELRAQESDPNRIPSRDLREATGGV
jgi:hypothetical protein